ncbi:hypothetical protein TNIN_269221 [Trichonephila inaurata madagascariensis]|uniref:Uncharacterized protein n=1 Tax=Trichonephila inaurata madagascariensis TaxID=2747483 RepID=A0A8X7CA06_9ARAC|nr:hypothetical protein TNIN_269221 [Trichonephila inaurata madagascariensis]
MGEGVTANEGIDSLQRLFLALAAKLRLNFSRASHLVFDFSNRCFAGISFRWNIAIDTCDRCSRKPLHGSAYRYFFTTNNYSTVPGSAKLLMSSDIFNIR